MYRNYLKIIIYLMMFCSPMAHSSLLEVFVSILPQQYLVERIGGKYVNVHVMVKPGQSPETFEPSPKLMSVFSKSALYFTIGLPFEQIWIERVASLNDKVLIVETQPLSDTGSNILISDHEANNSAGHHHSWDPHTWLSPVLFLKQADIIRHQLTMLSPKNKLYYNNNYNELYKEVNLMHEKFLKQFKNSDKHSFITFHPAFSYFAREYGLTQISIEIDGKEPSAKQVAQVINRIQDENVAYILIEKQFNQLIPKTIARSVGANILVLDPLALDYLVNMKDIAEKINKALF